MAKDQWWIRDVDTDTKLWYAAWAKRRGLKLAEALAKIKEIVEKAESKL